MISGRRWQLFVASVVSFVLAVPATVMTSLVARADDSPNPGFHSLGFIHADQMVCGTVCSSVATTALDADPGLGVVLFLRGAAVVAVDAKTLQQRAMFPVP